jgi:hypothetical protein
LVIGHWSLVICFVLVFELLVFFSRVSGAMIRVLQRTGREMVMLVASATVEQDQVTIFNRR